MGDDVMNFLQTPYAIALPEIIILSFICLIVLVDVFVNARYRFITYWLTQVTLVTAFFVTLGQFNDYPQPMVIFSGNYVIDKLAVIAKLFIYLFGFFAFLYAREYITVRKMARSEYYLLGLFSILGMSVMTSADSFLTIYLGLELLSLPLYAMIALYKQSNLAL